MQSISTCNPHRAVLDGYSDRWERQGDCKLTVRRTTLDPKQRRVVALLPDHPYRARTRCHRLYGDLANRTLIHEPARLQIDLRDRAVEQGPQSVATSYKLQDL